MIINMDEQKLQTEEEIFQESYQKQAKVTRRVLNITFTVLGVVFAVMGILAYVLSNEPIICYVFVGLGTLFVLLGIILYKVIPEKGNYQRYKNYTEKFGYTDSYSINYKISLLERENEKLQKQIDELKDKIDNLQNLR